MGIVDSLFIKLGYDYDSSQLDEFNSKVEQTVSLLKKTALAAIGLAGTFAFMFKRLASNAVAQDRFGKAIGESRENIEAFARVADLLTGDRGVGSGILSRFNDFFNQLKAGRVNPDMLRAFAELRINFEDFKKLKPTEAALQFASAMQAVGDDTQDAITAILGLSNAERLFLQEVKRADIQKAMPAEIDIERIDKFERKIKELKSVFEDLVITIGEMTLDPLIESMIKAEKYVKPFIGTVTEMINIIEDLGAVIGSNIGSWIFDVVELYKKMLGPGPQSSTNAPSTSIDSSSVTGNTSTNQTTTVNQENNFEITSNNPIEVGMEIERIMRDSFKNAKGNRVSEVIS